MSLQPGHKLAHYEILEPIGKGGMGEVYRARDGKLGRDVAIKVLPDEFAENAERLARFKREAKVLASLNHPGIAAIHGLEESEGTHYLVLEFVPGETLAERIARGPIAVEEALDIASQIAEALEEAHERGIVHRDLKPANIIQTEDGKIKVLDFGLAKVFQEETRDADSSMSPTLTRDATRVGVILGTAAYMSPEQAKGKRVDKRADVWAFGVVVYEMLTGKRAFAGEDVSDTLAYVLTKEPEWEGLPAETPASLRQALRVCLTKDPKRRARDIADVRLAIDGAFETRAEVLSRPVGWRASMVMAAATALLLSVFTGVAVWNLNAEEVFAGYFTPGNAPSRTYDISPDGERFLMIKESAGGDSTEFVVIINGSKSSRASFPGTTNHASPTRHSPRQLAASFASETASGIIGFPFVPGREVTVKLLLESGGNGAALFGLLLCLLAGGARVAGVYYLMGFELMTLFTGGMGLMLAACLAKLHLLVMATQK